MKRGFIDTDVGLPHVKLVIAGCTRACSLNDTQIPAGLGELIVKWFEERATIESVQRRLAEMDFPASRAAVGRHRKTHLHPAEGIKRDVVDARPKSDLEVLETIIQRGSQQVDLSGSRISAEQLLRAIELKHKMTEGSVFDQMYDAMRGAPPIDLDAPVPPSDDPALAVQVEGDRDEA